MSCRRRDLQFLLKKRNHFEEVCRKKKLESKRVRQVQPELRVQQLTGDSSEYEYVWIVDSRSTTEQNNGRSPMTVIAMNDIKVRMMVDTGGSVNVMNERLYDRIQKPTLRKHRRPKLLPNGGGKPLDILGVCYVTIESKFAIQCHHFYFVKGAHGSLIGFNTAPELVLVNIVNKINSEWEEEHPGLTKGIGKRKICKTNSTLTNPCDQSQ